MLAAPSLDASTDSETINDMTTVETMMADSVEPMPIPTWKMVESVDANANDKITLGEFPGDPAIFHSIDLNQDDVITRDEVTKARKASPPAPVLNEPALELTALDPKTGKLVELHGRDRPFALIFGTHTCRPFLKQCVTLQELYEKHSTDIDFFWVYAQEARASDNGLPDSKNPESIESVKNHRNLGERKSAASHCATSIKSPIPVLIDDLDNTVTIRYHAHPTRLFIIGKDGNISYAGPPGPGNYVEEFGKALERVRIIKDQ